MQHPTRPTSLRPAVMALALAAMLPAAGFAGACDVPAQADSFRAALLAGINAARATAHLPALAAEARLQKAAQGLACDDAAKGIYSHTGLDGSTLATRLKRVGYPAAGAVENTGMGSPAEGGTNQPANIVAFWMTSPFHRRNMLNPKVRKAGIGLAHGTNGNDFWVVDFGQE